MLCRVIILFTCCLCWRRNFFEMCHKDALFKSMFDIALSYRSFGRDVLVEMLDFAIQKERELSEFTPASIEQKDKASH